MYNTCCVVNCVIRRKDVSFHRFPKSEIGIEKWLLCINSEKLRGLSHQELRKQFVCRKHFEKRFLASTLERARLRSGAYPSLFTASEMASGTPDTAPQPLETDVINCNPDYFKKKMHVDHTYFKPEVLKKQSKMDTTEMGVTPSLVANILPTSTNGSEDSDSGMQDMDPLNTENVILASTYESGIENGMQEMDPLNTENVILATMSCYESGTTKKPITSETVKEREAGINKQIFEAIKKEVATWNENKKYCSILLDEVSLEAGLTYDKHKDLISGFVELNEKTNDFAEHFLVFMLRGVVQNWQQPVALYFCKGTTSRADLKKKIKEITTEVINTGLLPLALVSDPGTAFQSALKSLQQDTRRKHTLAGDRTDEVIDICGHSLSVIHDPPHLIKGLRNNFITKNIKYENKISRWSDIVDVYKADCNHAQMRLLNKLNDEHVIPGKIKKTKVKNCTRVFSKTVAAALSYTAQFSHHADGSEVSTTMANTAEVVSFFDDLFDSVNGTALYSKKSKGKPLRQAVTETSPNHEFWNSAIKKLEKIKFIDSDEHETSVPSLNNWIATLKSYKRVWQFLKEKNIKIMRPRYLNSDPIENFFGQ